MSRKRFEPPKGISPAAAAEWRQLVKLLGSDVSERDRIGLTILATSYADYREAQRQVDENGTVVLGPTGQPIKNPYCLVLKESFDRIRPLLTEFRLTPQARGKMTKRERDALNADFELDF